MRILTWIDRDVFHILLIAMSHPTVIAMSPTNRTVISHPTMIDDMSHTCLNQPCLLCLIQL